MQASPRFWNRLADRYERTPIADEEVYKRKLAATQARFHTQMQVLELGCGTGSTAILHAPFVAHLHAVDFSERMIGIAREKAAAAGVANLSFEVADVDTFAPPAEGYDAVLALSLLHLVDDRAALLSRMHGWLKPGGLLVTSTACLGDWLRVMRLVGPLGERLGLLPRVRVFTGEELADSIRAAGFRIEENWRPGKRAAVFIIGRKSP